MVIFTHLSPKTTPSVEYKFANIHICYCIRIYLHGYGYCSCVNKFFVFFSLTHSSDLCFLFFSKSFLSHLHLHLHLHHLLTHSLNKTKPINHPPLSTHHTQAKKSHLSQTPKPKSNYTHNSELQKPNWKFKNVYKHLWTFRPPNYTLTNSSNMSNN